MRKVGSLLVIFFANSILFVIAATVVAIIIRADSVMARSGIADNKFNAPFFHIFSLSGSTKYEH